MRCLCFLLIIFLPFVAASQVANTYNLNIADGLPDSRVYAVMTDRHGYLWIATSKGVLRYNGYDVKLFNSLNGLPNENIWTMVEDRAGRIWLGNVSDEMGYIYNNRYHNATLKDNDNIVYPKDLMPFGGGVIFQSTYISGDNRNAICIGGRDSVHKLNIPASLFGSTTGTANEVIYLTGNSIDNAVMLCNKIIYKTSFGGGKLRLEKVFRLNDDLLKDDLVKELPRNTNYAVGHYLINYGQDKRSGVFSATDLHTGKKQEIDIGQYAPGELIAYIHWDACNPRRQAYRNTIYVVTGKRIIQFECENGIKYIRTLSISDLVPDSGIIGDKILTIYQDPFWGNCIGTKFNGLYINNNIANRYVRSKVDLTDYNYIGGITDSICFWWNAATNTMARASKHNTIVYYKYNDIGRVNGMIHYNADTFLVTGAYAYWFINSTGRLIKAPQLGNNIFSIIKEKDSRLFVMSNYGIYTVNARGDSSTRSYLAHDRYYLFVYDSLRKNYWAYNTDKIFIHKPDGDTFISKNRLADFGVKKLEKVLIDDTYGNIFMSGYNNITLYDYEKNSYRQLFENFNLKETSIDIYHNTLIAEGHFGILFCKILGPQKLSEPVVYQNSKNIFYNFIYNYKAFDNKLLVVTDKGTYNLAIPSDSELINTKPGSIAYAHKFIVSYKDSMFNAASGDTIFIDQKDLRLQFDMINLFGNGHVQYRYKMQGDPVWHELNANELTLPALSPDNYYLLSISATDNVWKSDAIDLRLYVQPYWWQTTTGRRVVWLMLSMLVIAILTAAVLVTRRLVLRASRKKNFAMELELKSIHAQINPHFIFNTLNAAMYLIKTKRLDDAYQHIFKFSHLLRSYIKSSRNRMTTLNEELVNLGNYIDLQQARFKDKFDYEIRTDAALGVAINIPSLLLQPIVENAIVHGLLPKEDKGRLIISFEKGGADNEVVCTIDDDGIGREQSAQLRKENPVSDKGYGSLIVADLIAIFNKYEQVRIAIEYIDKVAPLSGTTVRINIKDLKS